MKFFKNNKAITLIELITSIAISSILFSIIFVFITDSVEELVDNHVKVTSVDEWFWFKDTMWRFVRWWYVDAVVLTGITDPWYTWTTQSNPNNVLYLKKLDRSEWLLIWVVDLNNKNLERNYIYWDNFLWYRYLSVPEMTAIDADYNLVYSKFFTSDKIFRWLRMKDFTVDLYNSWDIIDIKFTVINLFDETLFWEDFADFFLDKLVVDEYNLIF